MVFLKFVQRLKVIHRFWHILYIHKPTVFTPRCPAVKFSAVKKVMIL